MKLYSASTVTHEHFSMLYSSRQRSSLICLLQHRFLYHATDVSLPRQQLFPQPILSCYSTFFLWIQDQGCTHLKDLMNLVCKTCTENNILQQSNNAEGTTARQQNVHTPCPLSTALSPSRLRSLPSFWFKCFSEALRRSCMQLVPNQKLEYSFIPNGTNKCMCSGVQSQEGSGSHWRHTCIRCILARALLLYLSPDSSLSCPSEFPLLFQPLLLYVSGYLSGYGCACTP
jgi:hypothetical protein